jgi:hypothetical protein
MATATFFVTTARSGTQWLTRALNRHFDDLLEARHEPVGYLYSPRRTLRDPEALERLRAEPAVAAHFDHIHDVLAERAYVEVGFPAYALAPLLRAEFGENLRLVQLVRHPVKVAASLVTHGWYCRGLREDIARAVAPTPADPGVTLKAYAARWPAMTPFEKNLFYWYEVHRFGKEVAASGPPGGFARFRLEDLAAAPEAREALRDFLGLPARPGWSAAGQRRDDRFRAKTDEAIDPAAIARHPEILALAHELGYAPEEIDAAEFAARYVRSPLERLRAGLGRARRRIGLP